MAFPPQGNPNHVPFAPPVMFPNAGAGGIHNSLTGSGMPFPPPFAPPFPSPFLPPLQPQAPPFLDLTNPLPPTESYGAQLPGSQPISGNVMELQPQSVPGQPVSNLCVCARVCVCVLCVFVFFSLDRLLTL